MAQPGPSRREPTPPGMWRKPDGTLVPKRPSLMHRKRKSEEFCRRKNKEASMLRASMRDQDYYNASRLDEIGYSKEELDKLFAKWDEQLANGEVMTFANENGEPLVSMVTSEEVKVLAEREDVDVLDEHAFLSYYDDSESIFEVDEDLDVHDPINYIDIWSPGHDSDSKVDIYHQGAQSPDRVDMYNSNVVAEAPIDQEQHVELAAVVSAPTIEVTSIPVDHTLCESKFTGMIEDHYCVPDLTSLSDEVKKRNIIKDSLQCVKVWVRHKDINVYRSYFVRAKYILVGGHQGSVT